MNHRWANVAWYRSQLYGLWSRSLCQTGTNFYINLSIQQPERIDAQMTILLFLHYHLAAQLFYLFLRLQFLHDNRRDVHYSIQSSEH